MSEMPASRRSHGRRWRGAAGERGQILILTAVSVTALLGIAALSIDASFMYDKRNRLHAAADAAARSGAIELMRGTDTADIWNFAKEQVERHEFDTFDSPAFDDCDLQTSTNTRLVINIPPLCEGPFQGEEGYVEALVTESSSTFFGSVLGIFSMNPGARAVAGTSPSSDCIITLNSASISGNATINAPGCDVTIGGDITLGNPNAAINASGVGASGYCIGNGLCDDVAEEVPHPADPLAAILTPPTVAGPCPDVSVPGGSDPPVTLAPGCYNSIDFAAGGDLILSAGIYRITGAIGSPTGNGPSNITMTGSGVMLYLDGAGHFNVGTGAVFNLSAPIGGDYNGILIYQDPDNPSTSEFRNNGTLNLSGVIYMPTGTLITGNSFNPSNDCTLIVVSSFDIGGGNGSFTNTCAAYGGSPLQTVTMAE